jgi:uncharacterized protein GlcG (DUF336 family)
MTQISPVILPLEQAHAATAAAIDRAKSVGIPYTIAVVDGAGHVVTVVRMDGAAIASIDTSIAKARTSVYFGAATKDLAAAVADGQPLATIQTSTSIALAFVAGAVPLRNAQGVVIGAIGAGGGSPQQDHDLAAAAAAAV